ncbi:MAG: acyl--CoA ligase [Clostridia bacterium]|nr:acyl--CoA ligase [Clostridia bacterium]
MNTVANTICSNAQKFPEKTAIHDEKGSITYAQLDHAVKNFAKHLKGLGLPSGSRIMVQSNSDIPTVVSYLAIQLSGNINVPCEKTASVDALELIASETEAAVIITDADVDGRYTRITFSEVMDIAGADDGNCSFEFDEPDPEAVCDILFTTGTTGKSKGVMISNRALLASCGNLITGSEITETTVYLIPVPINHANGIRKTYSTLFAGGTVVLLEGLSNLKKFYGAISEFHANYLLLPPSAIRMILLLSAKDLAAHADQIEYVHTSAAPFPEADKQKLCELLPNTKLVFAYGSSEVANVSMFEYSKYPGRICCVGSLNINAKAKIVDEDGNEIESSKDNQGIIMLGGSAVMTGYYNAPELTAGVLKDGWVKTSDLGYFDEDGFLYVLGRADDVINVGGLKIAPTEVENVVMQYKGIAECACFGIDDRMTGKIPKLNIVPERRVEIDIGDLKKFLASKMEAYKVPKKIEIVAEIPKTSNGKINRKVLK